MEQQGIGDNTILMYWKLLITYCISIFVVFLKPTSAPPDTVKMHTSLYLGLSWHAGDEGSLSFPAIWQPAEIFWSLDGV